MKRTATWAAFICIVAVIASMIWANPYHRSRQDTGGSHLSDPPVATAIQLGVDRLTAPGVGGPEGLHPRRTRNARRMTLYQLPDRSARATTFRSATSDSYAARRPSASGARNTAEG